MRDAITQAHSYLLYNLEYLLGRLNVTLVHPLKDIHEDLHVHGPLDWKPRNINAFGSVAAVAMFCYAVGHKVKQGYGIIGSLGLDGHLGTFKVSDAVVTTSLNGGINHLVVGCLASGSNAQSSRLVLHTTPTLVEALAVVLDRPAH